jgi:hypothetical protein
MRSFYTRVFTTSYFKIALTTFILTVTTAVNVFAQQTPSELRSGDFIPPNNWGGQQGMSVIASTFYLEAVPNAAGNKFFRFRHSGSNTDFGPNSNQGVTLSTPFGLGNSGSGAYFFNATTGKRYVFKSSGQLFNNPRGLVLELDGVPQTFSGTTNASQSPSGASVAWGSTVAVSAPLSNTITGGQGVYLRYTIDNFTSSTIVECTHAGGNLYTANIPASVNVPNVTVRYYFFTSRSGLTIAHADADLHTINLNNNNFSNYSYTTTNAVRFVGDNFNMLTPSNGSQSWTIANANNTVGDTVYGTFRFVTSSKLAGDRFWRFRYGSTEYGPGSNTVMTLNTPETRSSGNGGALQLVGTNTSDRYIFKALWTGSAVRHVAMKLGAAPQTFASNTGATQSPLANAVVAGDAVNLSVTLSGNLVTDQAVYVRYSTNNFSTATVTQMSTTGSTATATIPSGTNTAGATVRYQFFTSRAGLTIDNADVALFALNYNNNNGSNYSYTVPTNDYTSSGNDWNNPVHWVNGSVPPTGANVIINSNMTMPSGSATLIGLTINNTFTFTLNSGATINLQASGDATSIVNNGTFTANGNINFQSAATNQTLTHTISGNAVSFGTTATVTVSGAKTGENVALSYGANFYTVNGTLQLNAGGTITASKAPFYGSNSTLVYNNGGTVGRSVEWSTTSGAGYPANVIVKNNTTINVANGDNATARTIRGNMTIESGSTVSMQALDARLSILGSVDVQGTGAIVFSSATNGNFVVRGNVNFSTTSTITANGKALVLEGPDNCTVVGGNKTIPTLTINKTTAPVTVTFNTNALTVSGTATVTTGVVIPNGNLTIGAAGTLVLSSGNGTLETNSPSYVSGSTITYGGSTARNTGSELNTTTNLTNINLTNSGGVTLASIVTLASGTNFNVNTPGILIAGNNTLSGAGAFVLNGGELRTANTSGLGATLTATTRTFTSGTIAFNAGAAQDFGSITNTGSALVTFAGTGTTLNIASGTYIVRQLNITSGNTFTLASGATLALTSASSVTSLTRNGTANFNGTVSFVTAGTSQNIVHMISGTNITFNNVTISGAKTGEVVGLSAGSEYLVNGELQINRGGYIGTTSPSYGASSTLIYNIGEGYGRGAEWNANSGVQGYPMNLIVRGSGTNLGVNNSAPTVNRAIRGSLTVENGTTFSTNGFTTGVVTIGGNATVNSGGTITMGSATAFLNVDGNIDVQNGGTLTLSSAIGGDLGIGTNFTLGSSATFTHNTRELVFYGSNNSVISGGGGTLGFMHINKATSSQTVTCNTNLNIANRIRFTNGTMNPNGFLTINNGASVVRTTANGTFSSAPTYVAGSIISYEGTTGYSTSSELPNPTTNITTINVTNTSGVNLAGNLALASGTTLNLNANGILASNGNAVSGSGNFNLNGGTLRLSNTGGIAATLTGTNTFGSGTIDFNSGGTQSYGAINGLSNINIAAINNTTVNLDGATSMRTLFTGPGSTFSAGAHTITITTTSDRQSFINNGTFVPGTSTVVFAGGGAGVEHILVGTIPFHNVTIDPINPQFAQFLGVDFGGASTINIGGTLFLKAGSYCFNNSPTYSQGATLRYETGFGTYNVNSEWNNPWNVAIGNNTTLSLGNTTRTVLGDLSVDAGSTVSLATSTFPLNVNGNMTLNGTLTMSTNAGGDVNVLGNLTQGASSVINFNSRQLAFTGTGNQTWTGGPTTVTVPFFAVSKASGIFTLGRGIELGNGTSSARFLASAGTTNLNGQTITFSGSGAKQLRLESNGILATGGSSLAGFNEFHNGTAVGSLSGTIRINGSGAETLPAGTFNNISLETSGVKTLTSGTTVNGFFRVKDAATVAGVSPTYPDGGRLEYEKTGDVTVSDVEWPASGQPTRLTLNLTGGTLTLPGHRTLANDLTITSGNINTDGYVLSLGTSTSQTGTFSAAAGTKIIGTFRRWVASSTGTYDFPMGTSTTAQPATINFTSAPTGGTLTTDFVPLAPSLNGLPVSDNAYVIDRVAGNGYWSVVANDGLSGGTYTASFTANNFTGINDITNLRLIKRSTTTDPWTVLGTHVAATGSTSSVTFSRSGLTSFSEFGLGSNSAENPLPVTFASFNGKLSGTTANLTWSTLSEINNKGFEVEKSIDGKIFTKITFVEGNGTTNQRQNYSYSDRNATSAAYYRLKQVDFDGKFAYSNTIYLTERAQKTAELIAFPNPSNGEISLSAKGLSESISQFVATTSNGKVVFRSENNSFLNASSSFITWFKNAPKGVYFLNVSSPEAIVKSIKVIKE